MNYTLNQLYVFLKISQTKNITKAAEALHLTQPAVSIQLKNFQDQFEIPLTEIIGRQLYLTKFGEEIAEVAKRIIDEVDVMKHKSLAYKGFLTGEINIAVVSTGKYIMPYFLSDFLSEHKGVNLRMEVTNRYQVLESLEKNQVDFALVSVLPEKSVIDKVTLMENKLYLVSNSAWSERILENGSDLTDLPWIFREPGSATRRAMETFIANRQIVVNKKIELTSNEAVKQAILAGLGVSIMPLIGVKSELYDKSIKIIPLKGLPIQTSWNLIWLKGKRFSPVANAYLSHLGLEKQRIINDRFSWLKEYWKD
ncbi:MAG TPA: LysR family transcriptional regulator [Pelobium sp.]|nr:LysR family transcriptional regulator [Pelobium sp.]